MGRFQMSLGFNSSGPRRRKRLKDHPYRNTAFTACQPARSMLLSAPIPRIESGRARVLGIPCGGNFGSWLWPLRLAFKLVPEADHAESKKIEPVENSNEQAVIAVTQPKILRLKSFRCESGERDPLPVQSTSPAWKSPGSGTDSYGRRQSHGARVLTKRYWRPASAAAYPLDCEFPKHARVAFCDPAGDGGYCVGIEFEGPHSSGRINPCAVSASDRDKPQSREFALIVKAS